MDFDTMICKALGVPDAIPLERRIAMAHRLAVGRCGSAHYVDVTSAERAFEGARQAFDAGVFDLAITGLADVAAATSDAGKHIPGRSTSPVTDALDIASIIVPLFIDWARAHPDLDRPTPTS